MSFYCIQKWNHAITIIPSASVCMSPQRNFFPGALLSYRDSPFGGVALFPQGRNLGEFEAFGLHQHQTACMCILSSTHNALIAS